MASKYKAGEPFYSIDAFLACEDELVFVKPWKRAQHKAFFLSWQVRMVNLWVVKRQSVVRAIKIVHTKGGEIETDNTV